MAATAAAALAQHRCAGSAVQNDGAPAARPAAGGTANAARPTRRRWPPRRRHAPNRGTRWSRSRRCAARALPSLAHIAAYQQRFGADADLLALRAAALRETGQEAEAAQAYRDLNRQGKAVDSHYGLGMIATRQGDFALAAGELRQALALEPLNPDRQRAGLCADARGRAAGGQGAGDAGAGAGRRQPGGGEPRGDLADGQRPPPRCAVAGTRGQAAGGGAARGRQESALVAQAVRKQALRAAQEARSANSANSVPPAQPAPAAPAAATAQSQTLAQAQPLARRPIKIVLTPTAPWPGQAIPAVPAAGATTTVAASSGGN